MTDEVGRIFETDNGVRVLAHWTNVEFESPGSPEPSFYSVMYQRELGELSRDIETDELVPLAKLAANYTSFMPPTAPDALRDYFEQRKE